MQTHQEYTIRLLFDKLCTFDKSFGKLQQKKQKKVIGLGNHILTLNVIKPVGETRVWNWLVIFNKLKVVVGTVETFALLRLC